MNTPTKAARPLTQTEMVHFLSITAPALAQMKRAMSGPEVDVEMFDKGREALYEALSRTSYIVTAGGPVSSSPTPI